MGTLTCVCLSISGGEIVMLGRIVMAAMCELVPSCSCTAVDQTTVEFDVQQLEVMIFF